MYGILGYRLGSEHTPNALLHRAGEELAADPTEAEVPGAASDAVGPFLLRVAVARICL